MDSPPPFSKLPQKFENPLDWAIINALHPWVETLRAAGVSANAVTTLSVVCKICSLWYFSKGNIALATLLWVAQYVLDCLDGMLARAVGETVLGDMYDHVSDTLGILGVYVIISQRLRSSKTYPMWPLLVEALLLFVSMKHFICQERYSRENTGYIRVIGIDEKRCNDLEIMRSTRYLGVGTHTLWILCLMFIYRP